MKRIYITTSMMLALLSNNFVGNDSSGGIDRISESVEVTIQSGKNILSDQIFTFTSYLNNYNSQRNSERKPRDIASNNNLVAAEVKNNHSDQTHFENLDVHRYAICSLSHTSLDSCDLEDTTFQKTPLDERSPRRSQFNESPSTVVSPVSASEELTIKNTYRNAYTLYDCGYGSSYQYEIDMLTDSHGPSQDLTEEVSKTDDSDAESLASAEDVWPEADDDYYAHHHDQEFIEEQQIVQSNMFDHNYSAGKDFGREYKSGYDPIYDQAVYGAANQAMSASQMHESESVELASQPESTEDPLLEYFKNAGIDLLEATTESEKITDSHRENDFLDTALLENIPKESFAEHYSPQDDVSKSYASYEDGYYSSAIETEGIYDEEMIISNENNHDSHNPYSLTLSDETLAAKIDIEDSLDTSGEESLLTTGSISDEAVETEKAYSASEISAESLAEYQHTIYNNISAATSIEEEPLLHENRESVSGLFKSQNSIDLAEASELFQHYKYRLLITLARVFDDAGVSMQSISRQIARVAVEEVINVADSNAADQSREEDPSYNIR